MAPHCPRWFQIAKDGSRLHQMLPGCLEEKLNFCSLSSGRSRIRKMWCRPDCPRRPKYFQMVPDDSMCFQMTDDHVELLSGEGVLLARAVARRCAAMAAISRGSPSSSYMSSSCASSIFSELTARHGSESADKLSRAMMDTMQTIPSSARQALDNLRVFEQH